MNENDQLATIAEAAVATTDYTSIPFQLNGVHRYSIHVKFSSAGLGGTLTLQGSNDPTAFTSPSTADWVPDPDSIQVVSSGASHMWNITSASYKFMRFTWVNSAGTGTLTGWLELKFTQG